MEEQANDQYLPEILKNITRIKMLDQELLACALNLSDVSVNSNKFYVLQLLERLDQKAYFIYTRSGRVGYKGTESVDCFIYESEAVLAFQDIFKEKTGIPWKDRKNQDHQFQADKYQYIEMKYNNHGIDVSVIPKSKPLTLNLHARLINLLQIIFDPAVYSAVLQQYNVDAKRAPLGSISQFQINRAYGTLKKLSDLIDKNENKHKTTDSKNDTNSNDDSFLQYSSEFYTIIPSFFGMSKAPVLNTSEQIEEKIELLKILENLEVFKDMSKFKVHDEQYLALNCNLNFIPPDQDEASLISKYFHSTKGSTHSIKLKIKDMFKVNRKEEDLRFFKWKTLHNRQLLWHGSRLCNFVNILSKGMLLNPGANVTKTGAMFGHGLYFANCSTKSANYMGIGTSTKSVPGIMILCEVALGTCLELYQAQSHNSLIMPYSSVRGVGQNTPDPAQNVVLEDGLIIPTGDLIQAGNNSSLYYDEYIVYDQSQVRIKYLILFETK